MQMRSMVGAAFVVTVAAFPVSSYSQRVPTIAMDGSSTVFPVSEAVAEDFQLSTGGAIRVTVGISGTGGGFKKFCRGEIAIANASRPILATEIAACQATGIQYVELPVAYDALTVVINPRNTWLTSITVDELKKMWEPSAMRVVRKWSDVNPNWPNEPFALFGPGADSGTFDYFTEAIVGRAKASRGDYMASEDDNILVTGVAGNKNALGYFGYAYYIANAERIKAVPIVNETGLPTSPSVETVMDGSYQPLSRPIFIYVSAEALERPEVVKFTRFYMNMAARAAQEVKYIPLPARAYALGLEHLASKRVGTVFGGKSEVGLNIEEMLNRDVR